MQDQAIGWYSEVSFDRRGNSDNERGSGVSETIFHKIIRREIPADIVFEDELCIAFRDINPVSPSHLLIVPKADLSGIAAAVDSHKTLLGHLLLTAAEIARAEGISEDGYRIVINSGPNGQQTVFQLHLHLIGGRECGWPPG